MKVSFGMQNLWKDICEESERTSNRFGLQRVPGWEDIRFCRLDKEWLTDVFREKNIARIRRSTPFCIVAQTGSGKTTLIFKECVPLAVKEHGEGPVFSRTRIAGDAGEGECHV